jgi:hypothetical protein
MGNAQMMYSMVLINRRPSKFDKVLPFLISCPWMQHQLHDVQGEYEWTWDNDKENSLYWFCEEHVATVSHLHPFGHCF